MPVETATYIADLNANYPQGPDSADQGDNHLRLLKAVLKAQFPEFTAAALSASQAEIEQAIDAVTGLRKLLLLAGSAATPGLAFKDDGAQDTGFYWIADGKIGITCDGVLACTVAHTAKGGIVVVPSVSIGGSLTVTGAITGPGAWPIGMVGEWYSDSLPDSKYGTFAWANGGTVSAATYTELAALWPSRVSGGNITLPDRRDNSAIGKATMGGAADPGRISTYDTTALWAQVGEGSHLLLLTEVPSHDHGGYTGYANVDHTHGFSYTAYSLVCAAGTGALLGYGSPVGAGGVTSTAAAQGYDLNHRHTIASAGSGQSHNNVQPGMVCNFVVRIA